MLVEGVVPAYAPSPRADATADPTLHLVLVRIRVMGRTGISLPPTALRLRSADGTTAGVDLIDGGEACEAIAGGIAASTSVAVQPTGVCFDIGGATARGLTLLVDVPEGPVLSIPLPAG